MASVTTIDTKTKASAIKDLRRLDANVQELLSLHNQNTSLDPSFADINAQTRKSREVLRNHVKYNEDVQKEIHRYNESAKHKLRTVKALKSDKKNQDDVKARLEKAVASGSRGDTQGAQELQNKIRELVTQLGLTSSGEQNFGRPGPDLQAEIRKTVGESSSADGYTFEELFNALKRVGQDLEIVNSQVKHKTTDIEAKEQQIAGFEANIRQLKEDLESNKTECDSALESESNAIKEKEDLRTQLNQLLEAHGKVDAEHKRVKKDLETLQAQLSKEVADHQHTTGQLNQLQTTGTNTTQALRALQKEKEAAVVAQKLAEQDRDRLQKDYDRAVDDEATARQALDQAGAETNEKLADLREQLTEKSKEMAKISETYASGAGVLAKLRIAFTLAVTEQVERKFHLTMSHIRDALDMEELVHLSERKLRVQTYEAVGCPFVHDWATVFDDAAEYEGRVLVLSWFCYAAALTSRGDVTSDWLTVMLLLVYGYLGASRQGELSTDFAPFVNQILENVMEISWERGWQTIFAAACSLYTQSLLKVFDERAFLVLQQFFDKHDGRGTSNLGVMATTALLRFIAVLGHHNEDEVAKVIDGARFQDYAGLSLQGLWRSIDIGIHETIPELAFKLFAAKVVANEHAPQAGQPQDFALFELDSRLRTYRLIVYREVDQPTSFRALKGSMSSFAYITPGTEAGILEEVPDGYENCCRLDNIRFTVMPYDRDPDMPRTFAHLPSGYDGVVDVEVGPIEGMRGMRQDFFHRHFDAQIQEAFQERVINDAFIMPEDVNEELKEMNIGEDFLEQAVE